MLIVTSIRRFFGIAIELVIPFYFHDQITFATLTKNYQIVALDIVTKMVKTISSMPSIVKVLIFCLIPNGIRNFLRRSVFIFSDAAYKSPAYSEMA